MPTDIFPDIDIPVVSVIWQFKGVSPEEMDERIVTILERSFTTTVNDIEHIESQSLHGLGVIKIFFHPGRQVECGDRAARPPSPSPCLRICRPASLRPSSCATMPRVSPSCNSVSAATRSPSRPYTTSAPTSSAPSWPPCRAPVPCPYGGKARQIMVDLDPKALYAQGLSPTDVSAGAQRPESDPARRHRQDRRPRIHRPPEQQPGSWSSALNDLPVKTSTGPPVYMRDVAQVRDGYAVQTNIVRAQRHAAERCSPC